jgi:hypothetical protein
VVLLWQILRGPERPEGTLFATFLLTLSYPLSGAVLALYHHSPSFAKAYCQEFSVLMRMFNMYRSIHIMAVYRMLPLSASPWRFFAQFAIHSRAFLLFVIGMLLPVRLLPNLATLVAMLALVGQSNERYCNDRLSSVYSRSHFAAIEKITPTFSLVPMVVGMPPPHVASTLRAANDVCLPRTTDVTAPGWAAESSTRISRDTSVRDTEMFTERDTHTLPRLCTANVTTASAVASMAHNTARASSAAEHVLNARGNVCVFRNARPPSCVVHVAHWQFGACFMCFLITIIGELVHRRMFLKANSALLGHNGVTRAANWPFGDPRGIDMCVYVALACVEGGIVVRELVLWQHA